MFQHISFLFLLFFNFFRTKLTLNDSQSMTMITVDIEFHGLQSELIDLW